MATLTSRPGISADPRDRAAAWIAGYRACVGDPRSDVLAGNDESVWTATLEELATVAGDDLGQAQRRVARHAAEIGTGFRIVGEADERPWPVSPVPLMIAADEWAGIAAGIAQRANVLEAVLADIYGAGRLIADGHLPAAVVAGSPFFLRPLVGVEPPGGRHLHLVAMDLGRGPDGEWRVLADHLRAPAGVGYALENRLAVSRTLDGLSSRLHIQRHAPFFAALRESLAALCRRTDPRIGLLTPGRFSPSYAEQAHLARYLGFLLVEGDDLAVLNDTLYVRTIGGLKRIDALWRRVDGRMLDPLAFDAHSHIGIAGLIDAFAGGSLVLSNAPGAGVLEAPALAAFLPRLARVLTGEPLAIPTIATWWCGQPDARRQVAAAFDRMLIGPAFGTRPLGLAGGPRLGASLNDAERATLLADMARRPQDYVGQEMVRLSTMPVVIDDALVARPFVLRVFATRDATGAWRVLPGGFVRIGDDPDPHAALMGEGSWSADVCIHGDEPVAPVSLLAAIDSLPVRRNPGTLPSRVADNFFWLGRYLERGEALLAMLRVLLGHSSADGGALVPVTVERLVAAVAATGAAPAPADLSRATLDRFVRTAMESPDHYSVAAINAAGRRIGEGSRDRLSADMVRLLEAPFPNHPGTLDRAGSLQRRYAALAGLSAEHMGRTAAWRFLDLGRRLERAQSASAAVRVFGLPNPDGSGASGDDLSVLLDLADSQISYRQRYLTGIARVPVVDLTALDPGNPRSLAHQAACIVAHLNALPVLGDDGLPEPQQAAAVALAAQVDTADAASLDADRLLDVERRLGALSDLIARRYFLQGAEPLRAAGLTLA